MEKDQYLAVLENTFLTYRDLKCAKVKDSDEAMISLDDTDVSYSISDALPPSIGNQIYVREGLIPRLQKAQTIIADLFDGGVLDVVYGYRSLTIQTAKYNDITESLKSDYSGNELIEAAHKFIAAPDVASHPTGGAVDVRVLDVNGGIINMSTNVHKLGNDSYVFNPFISKEAWLNRQKLRIAMCTAGFAPFEGEWWHFSYGDREWATYYNKPYAIYNQIEFEG